MILSIWKNAGFYMLFYIAGLQGIGEEYYEAADLEGANYFQRLRYITIPLLGPTTAFVFIIALIHVFTYVDHGCLDDPWRPNWFDQFGAVLHFPECS